MLPINGSKSRLQKNLNVYLEDFVYVKPNPAYRSGVTVDEVLNPAPALPNDRGVTRWRYAAGLVYSRACSRSTRCSWNSSH